MRLPVNLRIEGSGGIATFNIQVQGWVEVHGALPSAFTTASSPVVPESVRSPPGPLISAAIPVALDPASQVAADGAAQTRALRISRIQGDSGDIGDFLRLQPAGTWLTRATTLRDVHNITDKQAWGRLYTGTAPDWETVCSAGGTRRHWTRQVPGSSDEAKTRRKAAQAATREKWAKDNDKYRAEWDRQFDAARAAFEKRMLGRVSITVKEDSEGRRLHPSKDQDLLFHCKGFDKYVVEVTDRHGIEFDPQEGWRLC